MMKTSYGGYIQKEIEGTALRLRRTHVQLEREDVSLCAKLFALVFAKRLKIGLADIIDDEQSGFVPGRNIINNIRLILDMIDYNEFIPDESLTLFVDFYKAFDTG